MGFPEVGWRGCGGRARDGCQHPPCLCGAVRGQCQLLGTRGLKWAFWSHQPPNTETPGWSAEWGRWRWAFWHCRRDERLVPWRALQVSASRVRAATGEQVEDRCREAGTAEATFPGVFAGTSWRGWRASERTAKEGQCVATPTGLAPGTVQESEPVGACAGQRLQQQRDP